MFYKAMKRQEARPLETPRLLEYHTFSNNVYRQISRIKASQKKWAAVN